MEEVVKVFESERFVNKDPLGQQQNSVHNNMVSNSVEWYSNSQPYGMSNSSLKIKSEVEEETEESSCAIDNKYKRVDGTIHTPFENADTKSTLDYEDDGGTEIQPKKVLDVKDTKDSFRTLSEDTDTESTFNRDETNIECGIYPFEYVTIVETKFENIDDFDGNEESPYVMKIKSEWEEDVHDHAVPENTSTNLIFNRGEANIEFVALPLEYGMDCKIEETQIEFGTESAPAAQSFLEFPNEKDKDCLETLSLQLNEIERLDRKSPNWLDGTKTFIPNENLTEYTNNSHHHQHSKLKVHKCSDCEKSFSRKCTLDNHRKMWHPKPHKCLECSKSFTAKNLLDQHQMSQHPKPHKCPDCKRSFSKQFLLNQHQMFRHTTFHKCPDCRMSFSAKYILDRHQKSRHMKPKPCQCPDCDKSFMNNSDLKQHQMCRHSKPKPHKCLECDKSFIRKLYLDQHRVTQHSLIKPNIHKCPDCDHSFVKKYALDQHQMSRHAKPKPHKCPDCNKSFAKKSHLDMHEMFRHSKPKPHKCPDCDWSFATKHMLKQHRMYPHSKQKPHKCPDCDSSFDTAHLLSEHQTFSHSDPHKCPECNQSFAEKYILSFHQISTHSNFNNEHVVFINDPIEEISKSTLSRAAVYSGEKILTGPPK